VTPANLKPTAATADALAWVDAHRACLGWSARAWARPWRRRPPSTVTKLGQKPFMHE